MFDKLRTTNKPKRGPEKGNLPFPGKLSFTEVEKILLMKSLIYLLPPKQLNQRRI